MENYELKERIVAIIDDLDDTDAYDLWNAYCEAYRRYEDMYYQIEVLDDLLYGLSVLEILEKCEDVNPRDDYVYETIYGFESCDYVTESGPFDADEIADYCADNMDALDCEEIRELFEELEEEEEEE